MHLCQRMHGNGHTILKYHEKGKVMKRAYDRSTDAVSKKP